jgi:hypothetical protein
MFSSFEERVLPYVRDRRYRHNRGDAITGITVGFLTVLALAAPAMANPDKFNGNYRCGGNRGNGKGNICIVNPRRDRRSLPSVPGPLPVAGAGVAFGFARQIRSRIKK